MSSGAGSDSARAAPSSSSAAKPWPCAPMAGPIPTSSSSTSRTRPTWPGSARRSSPRTRNAAALPTTWSSASNSRTPGGSASPTTSSASSPASPIGIPSSTGNSASPATPRSGPIAKSSELIEDYVNAARIAWDVGADFVDIKHCHGYLLHEVPQRLHAARQIRRLLREPHPAAARHRGRHSRQREPDRARRPPERL